MPKEPKIVLESMFEGGILINLEDFIAAGIAATLVTFLAIFFQKTATGRAFRAKRPRASTTPAAATHRVGVLDGWRVFVRRGATDHP